jgi:tetratricopeptide (TPR) repeat protein
MSDIISKYAYSINPPVHKLNLPFTYSPSSNDKIAAMRQFFLLYFLLSLVLIALIAALVYRLPPVNSRLSWRVDFALTYLRGMVSPAGPLPTSLPDPHIEVTNHVSSLLSPTNSPSPTVPLPPTIAVTPTPQPSPTPIPQIVSLPSPEWERQDINNCGPAALAMHLRFFGWEGDQKDIAELLKPFREDRNVNVEELAYYVRTRAGWLNIEYRVGGDLELLKKLLAAGIPVMIEESFYFDEPFWLNDDLWAAHYQLLTGYNEDTQRFTAQDSFRGSDQHIPYQKVDEYWQAFNRMYFVIYPPEKEEVVKTILGAHWDVDYNRQHALEVAQQENEENPDNAFAWFNLGNNLTYFDRYSEATIAFDKARELGLPQRMLRYQFSPFIAYFHSGHIDDVLTLSEYALKITKNSEEALLWRGWALYRQGDEKQAMEHFQQALFENPNYQDAQYAIEYLETN